MRNIFSQRFEWLNNYNNMRREYIIQIGKDQPYPFMGQKPHFNQIVVRTDFPTSNSQQYQQISQKVEMASKITSPFIIQIVRVIEIKDQKFTIDYQYVAEPLKNKQKITNPSFLPLIREKLQQVIKVLTLYGLKYQFRIQDMGLGEDQQLKLFIGLNFKMICEKERQNLMGEYQNQLLKFIELNFNNGPTIKNNSFNSQFSDYSVRLDKKLNKIEEKLQRRRRRKNSSSSSSHSDKNKQKSTHNQSNMVTESLMTRQHSNASLTQSATSSSCNSAHEKIHKSSFGDYSSASYCLNESKEDFLSKRISAALEKTQAAFKTYDKCSRKKHRW